MAISRVKTWGAEVLTFTDLNAEFSNIIDNALSLISPLTGTLNANLNQLTNLVLEVRTTAPATATAGRVWYTTDRSQIETFDASNILRVPSIANVTNGDLILGGSSGNFTRLGIGAQGQSLTVASGLPAWGAGGANILQVQVFS